MSIEQVLSQPNDSIGSATGFVSPYLIDFIALGIVGAVIFGDVPSAMIRALGLLLAAALALWAALSSKAMRRYIQDTPRSKIVSAAQGFVEIQGRCEFYGNRETQGFLAGPPCVWHRYWIFKWVYGVKSSELGEEMGVLPFQIGASEIPFVIRDEAGTCIVNPKGAKVISSSKRTFTQLGKFYSAKFIRHGANMYVIGEMRSSGCALTSHSEKSELSGLLNNWKKDKSWLMSEFDVDQNGELDQEEWKSAVKRATVIAKDIYETKRGDRIENVISKPSNGMPMLISDRHPDVLAVKFARLGYFNLVVMSLCVLAAFYQFL